MRGEVTILLLILLLIFNTVIMSTSEVILSSYQMLSSLKHLENLKKLSISEAVTHINTARRYKKGKHSITLKINATRPNPNTSLFYLPILSYQSCLANNRYFLQDPPEVLNVSSSLKMSVYTCRYRESTTIQHTLFHKENIEFNSLTTESTGASLLSNGYISILNTLEIQNDLTIISGSDIYIDTITTSATNRSAHLNLISLGGAITVKNIHGLSSIYVDSTRGSFLPSGAPLTSTPLTPITPATITEGLITGITRDALLLTSNEQVE